MEVSFSEKRILETVTLTMNEAEACALYALLGSVAGSRHHTARRFTESMWEELGKLVVHGSLCPDRQDFELVPGSDSLQFVELVSSEYIL